MWCGVCDLQGAIRGHSCVCACLWRCLWCSVSIHPSGHFVLTVVPGHVQLLSIVRNELHDVCDIPVAGASLVRYSNHGGKFVVVANKQVFVYSSFGPKGPVLLGTLFGHSRNVSGVTWSHDDTRVVTVGVDGSAIHWELNK